MYAIASHSYLSHGTWQGNRTTSATPKLKMRDPFKSSVVIAINEIPIYGATRKIRALQDWGADWDGAGAVAVSAATIARATVLVEEAYIAVSHIWSNPNVTASPHGEVVLEWWNKEKKLTIYVSENQSDYVKVWGPDIDKEMDDGVLSDNQIASLLVWLEM